MDSPVRVSGPAGREGAAEHLLKHCGSLAADESVLIVCDRHTRDIAAFLAASAEPIARRVELRQVPEMQMHGEEPPSDTADAMAAADLVLGMTWYSMAHTGARARATVRGARYLSLPEYSLELLDDPALTVDYREAFSRTKSLADRFTDGSRVEVRTALGTDIVLDITRRVGNCCPGFVSAPGELGSPPDIEANVSPIESASEGVVVVDGSIPCPSIGLLGDPVTLAVEGGSIVRWEGPARVIAELERMFERSGSAKARVLAECGVGLNVAAQLTGVMLTDEGAAGTLHFGFGSNATVGGVNDVPFHLDFVLRAPDLVIDGVSVLDNGEWVVEV